MDLFYLTTCMTSSKAQVDVVEQFYPSLGGEGGGRGEGGDRRDTGRERRGIQCFKLRPEMLGH